MLAAQNARLEHADVEIAYQVLGKQNGLWVEVIYEHGEVANKSAMRQGKGGRIGGLTSEEKKWFRNGMEDSENVKCGKAVSLLLIPTESSDKGRNWVVGEGLGEGSDFSWGRI